MEGWELDEYAAGWLVELEVFQRERNRGKAKKLGKGEQKGGDTEKRKNEIIQYRTKGEGDKGER